MNQNHVAGHDSVPSSFVVRSSVFRMVVALGVASVFFASCAGTPITVSAPRSAPAPTAAAPAPAPAAAVPAPAPAPAAPTDYLPNGHFITGFHLQPFESTLYDIPFVVAELIDPSERADGAVWVRPVIRVPGYNEPVTEFLTPHVVRNTTPAKPELLSEGTFVFVAFDADPRTESHLARNGHWQLAKVKDLSKVGTGIVVVEFHNSYHNEWRTREYHIRNTRVLAEAPADLSLAGKELTQPRRN